ncbi:hypothetical protein [Frankia sp. Cj3]|uniref:hypothetical protein n=1 Tax=Frankia sp. Cj3 TaxID=2880976 RepID=UPI001EF6D87C|nr:hypothetical protein [Frankia sp. Cj3]
MGVYGAGLYGAGLYGADPASISSAVYCRFDRDPLLRGLILGADATMDATTTWAAGSGSSLGIIATPGAYAGAYVQRCTRTGSTGTASATWSSATGVVTPSRTYLLSTAVAPAPDAGASRTITVTLTWLDASSSAVGSVATSGTEAGPGDWVIAALIGTAPAAASAFSVTVAWTNVIVGEYHWMDAVTMEDIGTDITGQVLDVTCGRGHNSELDRYDAGQATLLLDNTDGRFTPGRAGSPAPYAGNIIPRRRVWIFQTWNDTLYGIWSGYTTSYRQAIPGGHDGWSTVEVACVDAFRVLTGIDVPPPYQAQILASAPDTYCPLWEVKSAQAAGNLAGSGGSVPITSSKYGSGGSEFGAQSAMPVTSSGHTADGDSTCLAFNASVYGGAGDVLNFSTAPGALPTVASGWTLVFHAAFGSAPPAGIMLLWRNSSVYDLLVLQLELYTDGHLRVVTPAGVVITSALAYTTGATWRIVLTYDPTTGSHGTVRLRTDAGDDISYALTADLFANGPALAAYFGGNFRGLLGVTEYSFGYVAMHIALWSRLLSASEIATQGTVARLGGDAAENESGRVSAILGLAGWPAEATRIDAGLTTLLGRHWDATSNALALAQDAAAQGQAEVWIDGLGRVVVRHRQRRVNAQTAATFAGSTDTAAEAGDFSPTLDDALIFNVVEVTRSTGGKILMRNDLSIATYGRRKAPALELAVPSDFEVLAAAQWRLLKYGGPTVRVDAIRFRPSAGSALWPLLLPLEPGDRITLAELPASAPSATGDFFVERITWKWDPQAGWSLTLGLSPVEAPVGIYTAAQLDTGAAVSTLGDPHTALTY